MSFKKKLVLQQLVVFIAVVVLSCSTRQVYASTKSLSTTRRRSVRDATTTTAAATGDHYHHHHHHHSRSSDSKFPSTSTTSTNIRHNILSSTRGGGSSFPGQNVLQTFCRTVAESRRNLIAAGVARSISIVTMYPVDTIKTRIQMGQKIAMDGLYKGVGGSLFGQVPYGVLTFGSYEIYKQALLDRFGSGDGVDSKKDVLWFALAAVLGDVTGSGWLCPSEVVKQQLQAGMHVDTWSAVRTIWRTQGLAGFYRGYTGGLARDVPFRVAQLTSFEVTKKLFLKTKAAARLHDSSDSNDDTTTVQLSPLDSAVCGAIAGTFSAAITCPLDRVKTLLMTDGATYGGTVLSCVSKIWRDEGVRGLTAGMLPRVAYIAPSVAIFFIAYEQVQQRLK